MLACLARLHQREQPATCKSVQLAGGLRDRLGRRAQIHTCPQRQKRHGDRADRHHRFGVEKVRALAEVARHRADVAVVVGRFEQGEGELAHRLHRVHAASLTTASDANEFCRKVRTVPFRGRSLQHGAGVASYHGSQRRKEVHRMADSVRRMDAQTLTRHAQQAGDKLKQDVPSQYKTELKNVVEELTGRVDFVATGQSPRTKTTYQSLEASALAQQARHVISQIARNIPVDKRESLEIIETLASRVEFAAIGSPSTARDKKASGSSRATRNSRQKVGQGGEARPTDF